MGARSFRTRMALGPKRTLTVRVSAAMQDARGRPETQGRCTEACTDGSKRVLGGFGIGKKLASLKPVNSQVVYVELITPQPQGPV